jgi:hypothetical protein
VWRRISDPNQVVNHFSMKSRAKFISRRSWGPVEASITTATGSASSMIALVKRNNLSAVSDGTNGVAIGRQKMTVASPSDQPRNIADATAHIVAMAMDPLADAFTVTHRTNLVDDVKLTSKYRQSRENCGIFSST